MYWYHYHATKQILKGELINLDGIARLDRKVINNSDYQNLKKLIADIPDNLSIGGSDGLVINSLSLLHSD